MGDRMIAALVLAASIGTLQPADRTDRIAGQYVGPVLNIYEQGAMSGTSWFTVDKNGRYTGHTIARKPWKNCMDYDPEGWSGQLYRLGKHTFVAINDGASDGYVLHVTPDRRQGASTLLSRDPAIETNLFFRDARFNPDALLGVMAGNRCEDSEQ